jgi:ABC-type Fe3+-siderophore transport system permease subunit
MRKITSLTALVSFLLLLLNSVVLYIAPHGRIAYWADWRFWGLTKTEWANQHIIIGILFLVAIFVHTYYNWKPVVAYLKNQARQVRVFTREFNIALLLVVACTIGAYAEISPFRWVHEFSESIKSEAGQTYG